MASLIIIIAYCSVVMAHVICACTLIIVGVAVGVKDGARKGGGGGGGGGVV